MPIHFERKFFYLFTCEYCFSHYVTAAFLIITRYKLLYQDWRGYLIAGFSLVWVANIYMGIFGRLRLDLRKERDDIAGRIYFRTQQVDFFPASHRLTFE